MLYLEEFRFTSIEAEEQYLNYLRETWHDTFYPFGILSKSDLRSISFEPLTILYGNNGAGRQRR